MYVIHAILGTDCVRHKCNQVMHLIADFCSHKQDNPMVLLTACLVHSVLHAKLILETVYTINKTNFHIETWLTHHGIEIPHAQPYNCVFDLHGQSLSDEALQLLISNNKVIDELSKKYLDIIANIESLAKSIANISEYSYHEYNEVKENATLGSLQFLFVTNHFSIRHARSCLSAMNDKYSIEHIDTKKKEADEATAYNLHVANKADIAIKSALDHEVLHMLESFVVM